MTVFPVTYNTNADEESLNELKKTMYSNFEEVYVTALVSEPYDIICMEIQHEIINGSTC